MPLTNKSSHAHPREALLLQPTATDRRLAWFTALAIAIHMLEMAIPSPLPGIKPGLANIVTIVVLCCHGWRAAASVALLRVLAGSLLAGTFLAPTFMLSLSGALAATLCLGLGRYLPGIGAVGLSLLAGLAHMAAQFIIAYHLFVPHPALWRLLPVFMGAAVIFGLINGGLAASVVKRYGKTLQQSKESQCEGQTHDPNAPVPAIHPSNDADQA